MAMKLSTAPGILAEDSTGSDTAAQLQTRGCADTGLLSTGVPACRDVWA